MIIVKSNKVKNDQEEPFVLDRSPSNKVNKVEVREQSEQEWVFKCDGGREREREFSEGHARGKSKIIFQIIQSIQQCIANTQRNRSYI